MRHTLVALLALASAAPGVLVAQTPYGPLTSQEAGPLQRLGFSHTAERADLVEPGEVQVESWVAYSNIFEQDSAPTHELMMDLERLSTDVGLRWGVGPRLEMAARLSFETTGGGILDGFISGWHRTMGLPNANRGDFPFDAYAQRLVDGRGEVRFDLPSETLALEDVRLSLKWAALRGGDGRSALTLGAIGRIPTHAPTVMPRRADLALMALGRASWERWHVHGALGGATVRAARDYDGLLRPHALFADLAVERALAERLSVIVQYALESPRLQGFDHPELDGWPMNLVFGVAGEVAEGWRMDVSFQEDIPAKSPAADFTLGIGVRRSW